MLNERNRLPANARSNAITTHEVVSLFAYLLDDRQFDAIESLTTPDIVLEDSLKTLYGWSAVRHGMLALNAFKRTQHFIANHTGYWEGVDFHGSTYCIASHVYDDHDGERKYDTGLRYDEHIVEVGGAMKLRRRKQTVLWEQDLPTISRLPEAVLRALATD